MNENLLTQYTIADYLQLLKTGSDVQLVNKISDELNAAIASVTGGMDMQLFQLQKDLILFRIKYLQAVLDFDEAKQIKCLQKISELTKQLNKKKADEPEQSIKDPYKSFLDWLLCLKKYYGSDIDKNEDLLYLVSATEQMIKAYDQQKKQIENSETK